MDDAVCFATSGSTGTPRVVKISRAAWDWSARNTLTALGGPGRWVAALPPDHVGGAQVLNRARLGAEAGIVEPLVYCGGAGAGNSPDSVKFTVPNLITALQTAFQLPPARIYLSLVPTELYAVFAASSPERETALSLLAQTDAVLVGGAVLDANLRRDALAHGIPAVITYGMTETSGGCVYNGRPLPGVTVRIADPDEAGVGLVEISGLMLAESYSPAADSDGFYVEAGVRWFRTADLGRWRNDGTLEVLGRVDNVIVTGGVNVHPQFVEDAVEAAWLEVMGAPAPAVVLGVPDARWGQRVTAIVQHPNQISPTQQDKILQLIKHDIGSIATPKQILTVPDFPKLPSGKIDRKLLEETGT